MDGGFKDKKRYLKERAKEESGLKDERGPRHQRRWKKAEK